MAADPESFLTLAASILLANQPHTPDTEAHRGRIKIAVETARQIHAEVKRVLQKAEVQAR
jgi:hypothetical protein